MPYLQTNAAMALRTALRTVLRKGALTYPAPAEATTRPFP